MKRIVTFKQNTDGRLEVISISAPIDETNINILAGMEMNENSGFITADFIDPVHIQGKRTILYYLPESETIEVEYADRQFTDLSMTEKIVFLKSENESLRNENLLLQEANNDLYEELELTQGALFEVDVKVEEIITNMGGSN